MTQQPSDRLVLSAAEREFLCFEFHPRFGQEPQLAEGIFLRIWRTGPRAGQPKVPKAMEGLLARGLVVISAEAPTILGTRAYLTADGLEALRRLLQDRRAMDPERYGHLRRQLGLDPSGEDRAA